MFRPSFVFIFFRKGSFLEILTRAAASKLGQVRVVGEGLNEIMSIQEAFNRAEDMGLDLVMVGIDSKPPVVRIQDFKKLEYEKKKAKKANKQTSTLKEIQFKVNISDHDLATKVNKIKEFLNRGDKVKISVRLKGRERETPERSFELVHKIATLVDGKLSMIPGPIAMAMFEPTKAPTKSAAAPKASSSSASA